MPACKRVCACVCIVVYEVRTAGEDGGRHEIDERAVGHEQAVHAAEDRSAVNGALVIETAREADACVNELQRREVLGKYGCIALITCTSANFDCIMFATCP